MTNIFFKEKKQIFRHTAKFFSAAMILSLTTNCMAQNKT